MKRIVLSILLGLGLTALAQTSPNEQLGSLTQRLHLTPKQKVQLTPLVEKEFQQLKALRGDTSMGKLQKLRRFTEIQTNFRNQAAQYLDPKQQKELEQYQAERRAELTRAQH
ncbi:MAG: hypothetical protein JO069_20150 [Verrucomicrobia bacterium]|nr:hypothetical protein [Verrucomicrobiota bacterium]